MRCRYWKSYHDVLSNCVFVLTKSTIDKIVNRGFSDLKLMRSPRHRQSYMLTKKFAVRVLSLLGYLLNQEQEHIMGKSSKEKMAQAAKLTDFWMKLSLPN